MKITMVFMMILAMGTLWAGGKITSGKMDIQNQVKIKCEKIPGEKGLRVIVHDILIEGFQGYQLKLMLEIYKDSTENMPIVSQSYTITKKSYSIDSIEFEFPNSDIFRYLGKGEHKAYAVFIVVAIDKYGEAKVLEDSKKYSQVTFDFKEEMQDKFVLDVKKNMDLAAKYAEKEPVFGQLITLCSNYGINALIDSYTPDGLFTSITTWKNCGPQDVKDIKKYLEAFIPAWEEYPVELIKKVKIKAVAFVRDLNYLGGLEVGGLANVNAGILLMNINYLDPGSVTYLTHHEFFHYIDVVITGALEYNNDKKWGALNPSGFKYTGSGLKMIDTGVNIHQFHPKDGFVSQYAMSACEEEKAEVFAYLFDKGLYNDYTKEVLKTDALLNKKFDYMKDYLWKISPDFNEAFFQKLHEK